MTKYQKQTHKYLFEFIGFDYIKEDRLYARNCDRLHAFLQKMADEHQTTDANADFLSIMINSGEYKDDPEKMRHEMIGFFFAGMKTIQVSTTNLIYYMAKHPEYKRKLCEEVIPHVERASEDIVENLHYDTVMEFEYMVQCYQESLRIEAPTNTSAQ